ncbi:hypothetical protein VFPBJ_06335 [Purpureocillium lilacinum]|uniref:Uncharacterized protein n=1 Tax=Purpureocillium lilacinum TaxID=33203 RepID=A0A179GK10_PURLI|nr:hypothetical protein VFPBJ_06335 [Purpureocillium lilacinum]
MPLIMQCWPPGSSAPARLEICALCSRGDAARARWFATIASDMALAALNTRQRYAGDGPLPLGRHLLLFHGGRMRVSGCWTFPVSREFC